MKADEVDITQQPNSDLSPFMETVGFKVDSPRDELKVVRDKNQRLHIGLGNSENEREPLKQELVELRSRLKTERADRKQIEAQLSEKEQNSSPAATLSEKSTPDAATILSQLARQTQKNPRCHLPTLRQFWRL
jgi:chromosome segregation ATPase